MMIGGDDLFYIDVLDQLDWEYDGIVDFEYIIIKFNTGIQGYWWI
ncbi:hypothetical protein ACP8HI_20235 [Paenibacillus sp. FA6]